MEDTQVSIIMAAYNAEQWISEAIESVLAQSYAHWELLITDDCSSDRTFEIALQYSAKDTRIKAFSNEKNCGAAASRNKSLCNSKGRYIAFLDADDLWLPEKLARQIDFMSENHLAMCYTSYETIETDGIYRNTVNIPLYTNYKQFLKRPLTCSHTIMFDTDIVEKSLLVMPDIKRGQDAATWLKVLKTGITARGLDIVLAKNRKHSKSLSSNKFTAIKRCWYLYRKVEKLNIVFSAYCFVFYAFNAVKKRLKKRSSSNVNNI